MSTFLHPCAIDDPERMIETLEREQTDLRILGVEKEMSNSTIVSMIENRLPEDMNEKWFDNRVGEDRIKVGREVSSINEVTSTIQRSY